MRLYSIRDAGNQGGSPGFVLCQHPTVFICVELRLLAAAIYIYIYIFVLYMASALQQAQVGTMCSFALSSHDPQDLAQQQPANDRYPPNLICEDCVRLHRAAACFHRALPVSRALPNNTPTPCTPTPCKPKPSPVNRASPLEERASSTAPIQSAWLCPEVRQVRDFSRTI